MKYYDEDDDFIEENGRKVRVYRESRGLCNLLALVSFLILYGTGKFAELLFSYQYMWLIIWILAVPYLTGIILYMILKKHFENIRKIDRTLDFLVPVAVLAIFIYYLKNL